jgi:circadian clock protein KaiC
MFISLTAGDASIEQSGVGISSLMDSWLLVRNVESGSERNRCLYILKSRGMEHSNQVREFVLSKKGIGLVDVCTGDGTVFTGSARLAQEAREKAEAAARADQFARQSREFERERAAVEAQIAALRAGLENRREELEHATAEEGRRDRLSLQSRAALARNRMADKNGRVQSKISEGSK